MSHKLQLEFVLLMVLLSLIPWVMASVFMTQGAAGVPQGTSVVITSGACPVGFAEDVSARGFYLRGVLAAGETIGTTVGAAMTANEARVAGSHAHNGLGSITTSDVAGVSNAVALTANSTSLGGNIATSNSMTTVATGTGTTAAPYLEIMLCKKT